MHFGVVTIFPEYFKPLSKYGIFARAIKSGLMSIKTVNPRTFTEDKYQAVDDTPYGGGAGMVMTIKPILRALHSMQEKIPSGSKGKVLLLSASGQKFNQSLATELSQDDFLILIAGRYEGVDQRVADYLCDGEISIGDYVLSGGELAAACVIDSVARLLPGVLGSQESLEYESFGGLMLEYPQYTKPESFYQWDVPKILLSGHHKEIEKWRSEQSVNKTKKNRPDLI
jgi:tRNA (guanine37-N1)-methyltransferase